MQQMQLVLQCLHIKHLSIERLEHCALVEHFFPRPTRTLLSSDSHAGLNSAPQVSLSSVLMHMSFLAVAELKR